METTRGKKSGTEGRASGHLCLRPDRLTTLQQFFRTRLRVSNHTPIQPQYVVLPVPLLGRVGVVSLSEIEKVCFHKTGLKVPFIAPRNAAQTTQDRIYAVQIAKLPLPTLSTYSEK